MYVFKHTMLQRWDGYTSHHRSTLNEMSAAELRDAVAAAPEHIEYERTSPEQARKWVSEGGHHSTPLYTDIDEFGRKRVRYARDGF